MGLGEQQTLFPFLGQGSIPQATVPVPSDVQVVLPTQNSVLPDPTRDPARASRNSTRGQEEEGGKINPISRILNKSEPSENENLQGGELPSGFWPETQMTSLDEDINSSRRKRRRVSAGDLDRGQRPSGGPLNVVPNSELSSSGQQSEEAPDRERGLSRSEKYQSKVRLCKLVPKQSQDLSVIDPLSAPDQEPTAETDDTGRLSPKEGSYAIPQANVLTPDSIEPANSDTELIRMKRNDPASQKKTLKLNPNGKLLSSPTNNRGQSPGMKRGRRSKARKKNPPNALLITIKYPIEDPRREHFGRLIDDICNGLTRYPPPTAPSPPTVSQNPSKPTHPFFLGKPSHQTNKSAESSIQFSTNTSGGGKSNTKPIQPKNSTPAVNIIQPIQPTKSSMKQRPAFSGPGFQQKPRLTKGSNMMEALWPPREFSYISAAPDSPDRPIAPNAKIFNNTEKKGKGSLLGIPDSESILHPLCQLANASVHGSLTPPNDLLRRPERYVTDGRTLQGLVADELSFNCSRKTPQESANLKRTLIPDGGCHPAISRLASSIPTSWTSFDKGEFDILPWTHKYAPSTAEGVLQPGSEVLILRDWLRHLMVSTVDTGTSISSGPKPKQSKSGRKTKRNKRRKTSDGLDGFIVSSENEASQGDNFTDPDEDELSGGVTFMSKRSLQQNSSVSHVPKTRGQMWNAVLISGPSGCGKTTSVYAAAKELDFEVFELNPGSRRSAKDVLERVGDMTRNHLVHKLNDREPELDLSKPNPDPLPDNDSGKQSLMNSFFKQKPAQEKKAKTKGNDMGKPDPEEPRLQKTQKQSLILLEEVDVLFEEDKQFWSGVLSLIDQSKRPIIMTCRDEGLLPFDDLSFHTILRYSPPPCGLAVDFMLLLAASEGHLLQRKAVSDLYVASNQDLRASITELNFWCQMALGSQKSGIDWMLGNFRQPMNPNERRRVVSKDTYLSGMGWYNRDMACCRRDETEKDIALVNQCVEQWPLEILDWQEGLMSATPEDKPAGPANLDAGLNRARLEVLERKSEFTEMQSVLDLLCWTESEEVTNDIIDTSLPPMSDKQKSGYIEGYRLLEADQQVDFSRLTADIGSTLSILMRDLFHTNLRNGEDSLIQNLLTFKTQRRPQKLRLSQFHTTFEPIMENMEAFYTTSGRQAPSFENGIPAISEDLAPYIRSIIAFDLRLERRRIELSGLLSQGHGKRMRKTRASRAALEGGSKESTRRERWFSGKLNPARVLDTGGKGWQDLLQAYRERAEAGNEEDPEGSANSGSESAAGDDE